MVLSYNKPFLAISSASIVWAAIGFTSYYLISKNQQNSSDNNVKYLNALSPQKVSLHGKSTTTKTITSITTSSTSKELLRLVNYQSVVLFLGSTSFLECEKPTWVGDQFCDDETNEAICNFDDGDCCSETSNFEFCSACLCIHGENITATTTTTTKGTDPK